MSLDAFSLRGLKSIQSLKATDSPVVGLVKSGIVPYPKVKALAAFARLYVPLVG